MYARQALYRLTTLQLLSSSSARGHGGTGARVTEPSLWGCRSPSLCRKDSGYSRDWAPSRHRGACPPNLWQMLWLKLQTISRGINNNFQTLHLEGEDSPTKTQRRLKSFINCSALHSGKHLLPVKVPPSGLPLL